MKDIPGYITFIKIQPIDFGICSGGAEVYTLLSWVEGNDCEIVLPKLRKNQQYDLGIEAGRILKKIHTIPAPKAQESWESQFSRIIDNKINSCKDCPIKFSGDEVLIDYINENRCLLKDRPQYFHHSDYHVGNMILSDEGRLSVIDFNRFNYGDPWEEFNRIVWCYSCSREFAAGRVGGYFNSDVPLDFWKLLALFISSNTLSSIYWAIPFGSSEVEVMLKQAEGVLLQYNNMANVIPKWYRKVIL